MLRKDIVDKTVIKLAKDAMKSGVSKDDFRSFLDRKRKAKKTK